MMKKYYIATAIILLGAAASFGFQGILNAEEETPASNAVQAPPGAQPFTVIISGTRAYSDVDFMRKGIQRVTSVQRFVQTISSQNHLQFTGIFAGDPDSLVAGIEGFAADRFEVQSKDDRTRGLVITLKKIAK